MREFKVDGVTYSSLHCNIERTAELKASDLSGMMLNKELFNDVLGTYMQYTVEVIVPLGKEEDYAQLYEVLSDPVPSHLFVLPYNQVTVEFNGKIDSISDKYIRKVDDRSVWRDTKFTVVATTPSKEYTLDEVITRGILPLPAVSELDAGKIYMVNEYGEWELTSLNNADETYY